MNTYRVLDQLESILRRSIRIPLTSFVTIDADRVLAILEKIRASFPEEIKQARYLTQENHRILKEAHVKAEALISDANQKAEAIIQEANFEAEAILVRARAEAEERVSTSEILRMANEQAEEITLRAEMSARETREGVDHYSRDVLSGLESELERLTSIVKNGKLKFEKPSAMEPDRFYTEIREPNRMHASGRHTQLAS